MSDRDSRRDPPTLIYTMAWLLIVTVLFFVVLSPYLIAVACAAVLAVIFYPLRLWLSRVTGLGRISATLIAMLACCAIVVIPTILLLVSLSGEVIQLSQRISTRNFDPGKLIDNARLLLPEAVERWLNTSDPQFLADLRSRLTGMVGGIVSGLSGYIVSVGQNAASLFINLGVLLYVLFFFLSGGEDIYERVAGTLPLDKTFVHKLAQTLRDVIRATVLGNFLIALIQGTIGGIALWALGVEGYFVLGSLMALFSLLPAVGAAVVWVPVAIWLAVSGQWVQAAVLVAVGALVIGMVDNVLRPPLVSKGAHMPDYLVFLATIGGISVLGVVGFVLGPIIVAAFLTTWRHLPPEARPDRG